LAEQYARDSTVRAGTQAVSQGEQTRLSIPSAKRAADSKAVTKSKAGLIISHFCVISIPYLVYSFSGLFIVPFWLIISLFSLVNWSCNQLNICKYDSQYKYASEVRCKALDSGPPDSPAAALGRKLSDDLLRLLAWGAVSKSILLTEGACEVERFFGCWIDIFLSRTWYKSVWALGRLESHRWASVHVAVALVTI
jgi:hypothetical protein